MKNSCDNLEDDEDIDHQNDIKWGNVWQEQDFNQQYKDTLMNTISNGKMHSRSLSNNNFDESTYEHIF